MRRRAVVRNSQQAAAQRGLVLRYRTPPATGVNSCCAEAVPATVTTAVTTAVTDRYAATEQPGSMGGVVTVE